MNSCHPYVLYAPPIYLLYLLTQLTFPAEYTHTCPQLYLQMNRVMLHTVTNIHQTAILNRTAVLLLYTSKDIHYIWENLKIFFSLLKIMQQQIYV